MPEQTYGYVCTIPIDKAMVDWERTRAEFLVDARIHAGMRGWPPPPKGDPALKLTYWRRGEIEPRVQCAPSSAEEVDLCLRWRADPEEWAREMAVARSAPRFE